MHYGMAGVVVVGVFGAFEVFLAVRLGDDMRFDSAPVNERGECALLDAGWTDRWGEPTFDTGEDRCDNLNGESSVLPSDSDSAYLPFNRLPNPPALEALGIAPVLVDRPLTALVW